MSTKRLIMMLLILLQVGFVSAEPLWMSAAAVEHHNLVENSETTTQNQLSEAPQEATHHCDVCHGHNAHLAVLAIENTSEPIDYISQTFVLPEVSYNLVNPNLIYRPPIFSA